MKIKTNRFFSIILTCLILFLIPMNCFAAEDSSGSQSDFSVFHKLSQNPIVLDNDGIGFDVEIPEDIEIDGYLRISGFLIRPFFAFTTENVSEKYVRLDLQRALPNDGGFESVRTWEETEVTDSIVVSKSHITPIRGEYRLQVDFCSYDTGDYYIIFIYPT